MPFTPFHMGPGIFIKSILQGSFSLMVFGWAQIIMDTQPLLVLLTGKGHLHGFSHTYLGASLLAVLAAVSGKYLSEFALTLIGVSKKKNPISIAWWVVFLSAFIGTFSHVFIDSFMHADIQPYFPFNLSNSLLGIINIRDLHKLCLYSGMLGTVIYFFLQFYQRRK